MRRRQIYAAQTAAREASGAQTAAAAVEIPPIPAATAHEPVRRPGHCAKCGQHIGRGLPLHERRCQG